MNNEKAIEQLKKSMELRGFAKSTQKAYMGAVIQLSKFHPIPLNEMDYDHVRDFLLHAINVRKLSSQFINTSYSGIKFLFEVALEREWNMNHIPRLKNKRKFPQILSLEEIMSIINSLSNLKHKAIMAVIYSGGLRVSEAANLLITDIDSKNMRIFIRQGKGNKDRYAQLANFTLEILREYYREFRPQKWLFQSEFSRKKSPFPIHTRTIQNTFKEAKVRAKITKNVTPHSMRHSYATHLVENGTNLIKVKELLGHDKLETTMLYIHLASKDILDTKSPLDIAWEKEKELSALKNAILDKKNLEDQPK